MLQKWDYQIVFLPFNLSLSFPWYISFLRTQILSHFSPLFGPSSARCVNLVSDLRCTSCPVVLMVLNHTFKVSYVLEGISSWTCYGEAVKGVDLQDTSYSAITAWMNTLCLLVNAKWVSPEKSPSQDHLCFPAIAFAAILWILLPLPVCSPVVMLCPEINTIDAYRGSTTSLTSKAIHLQAQLK